MTSQTLTIHTPAGTVHALAAPREADAVVFALGGAMRGSVHVTGTMDRHRWDQFTAVRASLGPVSAYHAIAPDDALPHLTRSRTGHRGSLTLYRDADISPAEERVGVLQSAAGNEPSPRTAETLTAVLRACAEAVAQRDDLPVILDLSRQRDTPRLLRFLTASAEQRSAEARQYEQRAADAAPALSAAVRAWWTSAGWFTEHAHPVALLMIADVPGTYRGLPGAVRVAHWAGPYCRAEAADHHRMARNARAEAESLRAQERSRRRRPAASGGQVGVPALSR